MANNTKDMANIMQALGILAETAATVHAIDVNARMDTLKLTAAERMREDNQAFQKEMKDLGISGQKELLQLTQDFQQSQADSNRVWQERIDDESREDRQAFQKELTKNTQDFQKDLDTKRFNREFISKYPGAQLGADGFYFIPEGYDHTASSDFKAGQAINVETDLRENGLSTDGTSLERSNRLNVFLQAKGKGSNLITSSIDRDVAIRMGGDATPGYFTERDISDFEGWFAGSGGGDSPMALATLVESGIISPDYLQISKTTGLYEANDTSKELITIAFEGLKQGAINNKFFKTRQGYEQMNAEERQRNMLVAESLTTHPYVAQSTNIFNSTKVSLGSNKINGQVAESGEYTMMWNGKQTELSNIMNVIDKQKGVFKDQKEKTDFKAFINTISTITAAGDGIEAAIMDANNNPRLMKLLIKFDQSLAKSLVTAQHQFNRIDKIAEKASKFIQTPKDQGQIEDFRSYIQNTGLIYMMQELRGLEASEQQGTKEYKELDIEVKEMIKDIGVQLQTEGDKKIISDFRNWLDLEKSTAELYKENVSKRKGI